MYATTQTYHSLSQLAYTDQRKPSFVDVAMQPTVTYDEFIRATLNGVVLENGPDLFSGVDAAANASSSSHASSSHASSSHASSSSCCSSTTKKNSHNGDNGGKEQKQKQKQKSGGGGWGCGCHAGCEFSKSAVQDPMRWSSDPKRWGPHLWYYLHYSVANMPEELNHDERTALFEFLLTLPISIPCESCRHHYSRYIESTKRQLWDACSSRDAVFQYLVHLHNKVNARNGKPEVSVPEAKSIFGCP